MFPSKLPAKALALLAIGLLTQSPAHCDPTGIIGYSIEWGTGSKANYTFLFSGLVTRDGQPCPNARVILDLETGSQGVVSQSAQAGEDGRYEIAVTVPGAPEDSSNWKLQASHGSVKGSQTGEAAGRVILMDGQTTVVVQRVLPLIEA